MTDLSDAFHPFPVPGLMHLGPRPAAVFSRGQGSWLFDLRGQRYLDLVQGWAVNTLGHAPPALAQALTRQADRLLQAGPGFYNDQAIELAQRLTRLSGLDRAFICTSGAEANEAAVKLARKWGSQHKRGHNGGQSGSQSGVQHGGANTVLSFEHSFHGRTLAMMAASGKPGFDRIYAPAVPGFVKLPFNNLAAVHAALTADVSGKVVAVLVEPVQGEAGVIEAEPGFLPGLRALCDAHRVLLIIDEVQTGIGRCGSLFAHTQFGVEPDILTLGKGLGGGVPIGAMLARESVCCFAPGDQGGTFHGNALVCAAALAVLDAVTAPGFIDAVVARGQQLAEGLSALSVRHGLDGVRGRGLLQALALPAGLSSGLLADAARQPEAGDALLVNPAQPRSLRLMPALNIPAAEVALALSLLDQTLQRVTAPAH